ncbi:non-ribosomal peptide synthetase [Paenibacillus piri]|uniref:Amino acid adenylation domain-containing protein n=1 Tax=Paenibacillus piri TaxID=2547395 RepID=A0A4V2ZSC2_9BACL|nr:non-ribosomal peptide synthetase [Paenibacillus piri]TDF92724.1 amino acid adenylation domain-containing protein [Paenibacillus piri]
MQGVYYPLTHAQKRIWYTEQFYPGTSISNLGGFAKLKSKEGIDSLLLMDAIRHFIRLNDSVRLRLMPDSGEEPRQYVAEYRHVDIDWLDYSTIGDTDAAMDWGQAQARTPMPLYDHDLFYFAVVKISNTESWFFAKVHHVICDGISMVLLTNQIIDLYLELRSGDCEPDTKPASFLEHIQSELAYEQSERFSKDKRYWTAQFASIPELASLKRSDSMRIRTGAERVSKVIPGPLQSTIQLFCKEHNTSPLALFLSILNIYMHRVTGQDDVVVGTFMANRTNAKEKSMIGMFVSTLPVRSYVDENMEFISFVSQRMKDQLTLIRHQKYPYNVLVNDLRRRQNDLNKLFGVSLEFQVMQWNQKEHISYLTEPLFSGHEINDISFHVKERWDTGALAIDMDYRTELFSADEIENLFGCLVALLEDALAHPAKKLHELDICSQEDRQRLLGLQSPYEIAYPKGATLHASFERQAAAAPEQTAVLYDREPGITYKELNEQANRLAHILQAMGVGPDVPIAILMERSGRIPAVILGILKAGGAYVPIDPDVPEDRIRFILDDSGAKVLLTESHLLKRYQLLPIVETLVIDDALLRVGVSANVRSTSGPHHLAYIIYTSGTTGKPKGVMIEHRQVQHLVEALRCQVYASYDQALNVALVAPFHFDASVQQIFASLLLGHTLCIVPRSAVSDGRALADYYRSGRIDLTDGTPAHVQLLLTAGKLDGMSLRHMLIGGEALPQRHVKQLLDSFAQTGKAPVITNVYGPTECCVDASAFEIVPAHLVSDGGDAYVSIGKPLGGNRFYILDKHGRLQPWGVPGELYIAGEGVGRGYLNLPQLTAEKFQADPFVPGERMYRTGDLARRQPDGSVQFIGRLDDQVKIRGYRIEPGEIEAVMQKHAQVRKAVVLARPDQRTGLELCAYVVPHNADHSFSAAEFREHLSRELPQYMVPSYFVELEELPLTSSGKIDRKALLRYEVTAATAGQYEPPATELEAGLAVIWQDVLGIERVGMHDHFFELGGHSLKAMVLLARVHKEYGADVPLQLLFESPTVRAVARYIAEAERNSFVSIEPAQEAHAYPLSFAQQRVYIVSQLGAGAVGYNMPAAVMLEGQLDIPGLERAFRMLIQRHEALRTSFVAIDGIPMQRIQDEAAFEITVTESERASMESAMASFVVPFDLTRAPLLRAELVRLDEDKHMMLVDMHHLISDGVSIGIILNDLARLYAGDRLPALRLQYKDYAVWQSGQFVQGCGKDEQYWLGELGGELPVLQLLTDYPRPTVQSFSGDRVTITLDNGLMERLNRLAEAQGATLYMVLLAAYGMLLSRYTGQQDILVGTPTAGRNHADLEGIVGMFVNTLPIRTRIDREAEFTELLQDVRSNVLGAFQHQNYPFERLVEKLALSRDLSRNPLFDTMFILQNAAERLPQIGDMRLTIHDTNFHIAKFDLTLQAAEEPDGITLDLDYSTVLFRRDTAGRMLSHYRNLLESIAANPGLMLGEYDLLTQKEKRQLLIGFNPLATEYPKHRTIVQLFEEQAEAGPNREALSFEGTSFSYGQLNERANQLARKLRAGGLQNGAVVALLMNRSVEMVVAVLAVLKAGGAYVPVDPEHPVQRIRYFIDDSWAALLLTQRSLTHIADEIEYAGHRLFADDPGLYFGDAANLGLAIEPVQLANLTYTSGTSGNPKGNMVTHANIVRTVKNTNYMEVTADDVLISLSNYVFDAFMFDVFGALLNGAKLVVASQDTILNISRLPQMIERERITVMMITTALFNLLVDIHPGCLSGIRKVLFGGERASVDHVRKALHAAGEGKLLHMYGPSESTVFATYYPVDEIAEDMTAIPIGKPVSNTTVYILDPSGQPQPIGVAGELCVGGDGLVVGYANRPELTGEKFVAHPFAENGSIYRTGDLARWLPDGNVEFIGRIDHQVKIRGQRIELGEIEHQLLRHEAIREAVVLAVEAGTGEKQLCAYIVTEEAPLSNSQLREHAAQELPAYMIPSAFIRMEKLPLTGNGKVDRRALPLPDLGSASASGAEYTAPRTATEAELAAVWQEVLGVGQVGVHDNFFELGGHSLKAMTLLARIHQSMRAEVPLRQFFRSPTVAGLAELISAAGAESNPYAAIAPVEPRHAYPVSSQQKRLYALHQMAGAELSYNMPSVLSIDGPLQRERFEAAMKRLVGRHEALRTSFDTAGDEPVQRIHDEADFAVSYMEVAEKQAHAIIAEFIRPFNLHEAPLLRTQLVRLSEERHLLLFDMHHIISDGTSVSVLFDELAKLYAGESLQSPRIQYKDYAVWQQSFRQTEVYRMQEAYWLEQFAGELPVLDLPGDYTRPAVQTFAGERIPFSIDAGLPQALNELALATGTTLYMVLLAAFSAFLAKLSGQNDVVVGSPVAGRPVAELERAVGMFVNTLAMRTHPDGEKTFASYLLEVKRTAVEAYECQSYPFEELVGKVGSRRDMSRNPLFDALFVMQNMDMRALTMDGAHLEPYRFEDNIAKFDLSLSVTEQHGALACSMEYNKSLFKRSTIERWIGMFTHMLRHIAAQPQVKLAEANLLTKEEKQCILIEFNDTKREYPQHKTIQELFEEQAERIPGKAAVVMGDEAITYGELNARANRLARMLRARGLQPDSVAGLVAEQSIDMVVGIIAILKAGGAYLPIDPNYPEDRLHYLIADSGAQLVLTQRHFTGRLPGAEVQYIDMAPETADSTNLAPVNRPEHLAYVIYTSGSTGQPKGVMVEHRNVVRLVKNAGYIPLDDNCRMAQTGAISFDASTFELFGALLNGGTLYPVPKRMLLDVHEFAGFLQKQRITTMWLTAPLFNQLVQENSAMFAGVRDLIIGGDALTPRYVNQVRAACPELALWNGYGPTENTTFSACFRIDKDYSGAIPIGKPIGNSTAYIVNTGNQPQPIGIPGELCVGGDGVARGYLNRADLTSEKFVDNPFVSGERMYRTGDLARWLADGNIEFLGRIDNQVKVRGFRIELGEIESQLLRVAGVNEAVVIARQDETGQNSLCAYITTERGLSTEQLRMALSRSLPGYMVPSYFVNMDSIPLTANGKVDRKSLPEPDIGAGTEDYQEPGNEKELLLAEIWQEVLGAARVGINDNFFSLGGDSIKAIQMAARLRKTGWKLDMKDLFQNPTIAQVSVYLQWVKGERIDQAHVEGEVPLTPIQHWFFEQQFTDSHHWNQSVMLHAPSGIKPETAARALRKLAEHHDALRMVYRMEDGRVVQYNRSPEEVVPELEVLRLGAQAHRQEVPSGSVIQTMAVGVERDQAIPAAIVREQASTVGIMLEQAILAEAERIQAGIDLSHGPLLKAALFQTGQGDHLLLVIHHLAVDGVSWRILMEDFANAYNQADKGQVIILPDKTHSYREWAMQLRQYADSKTLLKEIDYWSNLDNVGAAKLPKNHETADRRMRHARTVQFSLSASETQQLTTLVHLAYRTEMNDILLTSLGFAMKEWTGYDRVLVNLEGHGREDMLGNVNISRTVGWFTTQFPVLLDMRYSDDPAYQIKRVKEDLRHIPNKGIGFGILRYLTDDEHKPNISFSSVPEISFNYLGQFAETAGAGFKRSPLPTGSPLSPETEKMHPIDIVGVIEGSILQMTISYNALQYEERTMLHLSARFKAHLLRIMEHCLNQDGSELTPSDLGDDELTLEEFDKLLKLL